MQLVKGMKLKTFDYPPRKMFLKAGGKSTFDVVKKVLTKPMQIVEKFVHTYFGDADKIPFLIIYGNASQFDFNGRYSGNQCTSMSISAICWWCIEGNHGTFTPADVSLVMKMGDALHTVLRNDFCLSTEDDNRIAIDDLPRKLEIGLFERWTVISRTDDVNYVMTSPEDIIYDFIPLRVYLESRLEASHNRPESYLLTIGHSSNAVMYTRQGKWLWFDSHGLMHVSGTRCKDFGAVVELDNLDNLVLFVLALHGPGQVLQIVPLTCVVEEVDHHVVEEAEQHLVEEAEQHVVEEAVVEEAEPVPPSPRAPSPPMVIQCMEDDLKVDDVTVSKESLQEADMLSTEKEDSSTDVSTPPTDSDISCTDANSSPAPGDSVTSHASLPAYGYEDDDDSSYISFMGGFGDD